MNTLNLNIARILSVYLMVIVKILKSEYFFFFYYSHRSINQFLIIISMVILHSTLTIHAQLL